MHQEGYGARGIALEGPSVLSTTQAADAAINAGREYCEMNMVDALSPARTATLQPLEGDLLNLVVDGRLVATISHENARKLAESLLRTVEQAQTV